MAVDCLNPDTHLYPFDKSGLLEEHKRCEDEARLNTKFFPHGGLLDPFGYYTPILGIDIHKNVKWRYGLEYEVELKRVSDDGEVEWEEFPVIVGNMAWVALSRRVKNKYEGLIKKDSSLDRGFEIALAPMDRNRAVGIIMEVLDNPFITQYQQLNRNSALHVTVDPFDTPEQQWVFHNFWDHASLFDDYRDIIGRNERAYCKKRYKRWRMDTIFMKKDKSNNRYFRCLVRERGAMEVRVFGTKRRREDIEQQLEFVHLVNKAVRKIMICSYENIREYVDRKLNIKRGAL